MAGFGPRTQTNSEREVSGQMQNLRISEVKDTFLECPVCTEHFNQSDRRPRLLHSCLHAFCTQCLQQLLDKEGKQQVTCPLCRHVQPAKGKSDSLPVDPVRDKLTEYIQIKEQKTVLCSDCPDGNEARSRCQECLCYICEDCASAHRRNKLSRDHVIIPLGKLMEDLEENFMRSHFCASHPKHHLEFYCDTDDKLCCVSCCVIDHKGHDMLKLEDAAATRISKIETSLNAARQKTATIKKERKKSKLEIKKVQDVKSKSVNDINRIFDSLKEAMNVHRAKLLRKVEVKSNDVITKLKSTSTSLEQTAALFQSVETYFKKSKEKADVVEKLQMYPSIKKSIAGMNFGIAVPDTTQQCNAFRFEPNIIDDDTCFTQFGEFAGGKAANPFGDGTNKPPSLSKAFHLGAGDLHQPVNYGQVVGQAQIAPTGFGGQAQLAGGFGMSAPTDFGAPGQTGLPAQQQAFTKSPSRKDQNH